MALTKITSDVIETGAITSDKLASGAVSASSLSSITTDNVSEGSTNTYFTNARARGSVSVTGGGLSYDSGTGVIQIGSIPNASLTNSSLTVNSNSVSLGGSVTLDTDDIGEGSTNLYFTNARAQGAISGSTGVTVSGGAISIGQDVATSSTPTFGNITTTGYIAGPATFTIDPAAVGDNTGTVVIAGNLQVDGTTTTINSTTLEVDDLNITLASGAANAAAANGAGITVDGASATITYDGTNDEWDFNKNINVAGNLLLGTAGSNNGVLSLRTYDDAANRWDVYTWTDDSFRLNYNGAGSDEFIILNDGKVGIGTVLPGEKLHVYGNARIEPSSGENFIISRDTAGPYFGTASNHSLRLITNSGSRVNFDTDGRVLIGVTSGSVLDGYYNPRLQIEEAGSSDSATRGMAITYGRNNGGGGAVLNFNRHAGTSTTSKGNILDNYSIGEIVFRGYHTNNFDVGAAILARVKGTPADGVVPTELIFSTTNGSGSHINALVIDPNQKIGIGTEDPDTLLELRKDTSSTSYGDYPTLSLRNDNAAGYSAIHFQEGSTQRARIEVGNNSGTPYMGLYTTSAASGIMIKDGNVGIGTTTPGRQLEIFKAGEGGAYRIKVKGDTGYTGIEIENTDSANTNLLFRNPSYTQELYMDAAGKFHVYNNGAHRFTVDQGGNVGIGTTSPNGTGFDGNATVLSVNGYYRGIIELGSNNNVIGDMIGGIEFRNTAATEAYVRAYRDSNGDSEMRLGAHHFNFTSGNVGIGLDNPLNKFVVAHQSHGVAIDYVGATLPYQAGLFTSSSALTQTAYGDLNIKSRSDYTTYGIGFFTANVANTPTLRMKIDNTGNVGIGDTSPGHKLEVNSPTNYQGVHIRGSNAPCFTLGKNSSSTPEWRMGITGYDGEDFAISTGTSTNDRFRIDPDGNMILGSANNVTPISMHDTVATVSVSGPIASGYSSGPHSTGPRNTRDWFVYGGSTNMGSNLYVHMKTNLWGGGSPSGNIDYTMSCFTYKDYYAYGGSTTTGGYIGWHNWAGSFYNTQKVNSGTLDLVQDSYISTDGYVVLVAKVGASYCQFSIDWCQWAGYTFHERKVIAVTNTASATGAY